MENLIEIKGTELLAFAGYQEFEAAADRTAVKIKEGYLEMGYILKMARDTDILRESGYAGYEEFAEKRYGLDKGTVSRYIRIVERFSVDGNSHMLKDNYKNMGFAKLSIMLHMPDAIAEELMDTLSKTEVQAVREELEAEEQISDIELAIEASEAAPIPPKLEENLLTRTVWQLGKEQQTLYRALWKAFEDGDSARVKYILAPQGDAVYMVRIPGTGRMMLSISGDAVSVTEVRTQNKERYGIDGLIAAVGQICPVAGADVAESFRAIYDEELEPEKAKVPPVAPVQQPKKEKRKESKVTKARADKPAPAAAIEPEPEEQLPGQMNVGDYEGVVPEAQYEEVKDGSSRQEEKDGAYADGETGEESEAAGDDITGMPEGAGTSGDALGPGTDAGAAGQAEGADTAFEPDAGDGAAEGGGREADHRAVENEEEIWMDIRARHQSLNQYLAVWADKESLMEPDVLHTLYTNTVGLAAGLEKIMLLRGRHE